MPKESVLHRVRTALGRAAGSPTPAPPPAMLRQGRLPEQERLALFQTKLVQLSAQPYVAAEAAEARAAVERILAGRGAVASRAPVLAGLGITGLAGVRSDFAGAEALREACAQAPFGITSADYGLAESGTLVVFASSEARMISLLEPEHIVVLRRERILDDVDALFETVPLPAERSSSMVFISGPSRTGDIELTLVRGVHGPRELYVIIV